MHAENLMDFELDDADVDNRFDDEMEVEALQSAVVVRAEVL